MNPHYIFNDTYIYIESLDFDIDFHLDTYSEELKALTNVITSPRRKREVIMAHIMVKKLISPHATICHTPHGAPFIKDFDGFISISHSSTHIALAINHNHPIGIDLENWREQLLKVKSRFLSEKEAAIYTSPMQLLQAWTAKEAIYKIAQSPGISLADDISLPSHATASNLATVKTPNGTSSFSIHHIESTSEQCLTLACPI